MTMAGWLAACARSVSLAAVEAKAAIALVVRVRRPPSVRLSLYLLTRILRHGTEDGQRDN